jgi:hypothetical protein
MSMKASAILVAAGFGLAVSASSALACKGPKVQFTDDFRAVDQTWGTEQDGDAVTVENGKVKFKADADAGYAVLYGGIMFTDADLCVTVQMPNNAKQGDTIEAGPLFWAEDHSNYYYYEIDPSGKIALDRKVKGRWVTVLGWRPIPTAKTGPGAKNVLRVTTSGGQITLYLNDEKVATVKGQQPDNGGQIGLRADSERGKRDTWKFMNLKVTDVAPAQ